MCHRARRQTFDSPLFLQNYVDCSGGSIRQGAHDYVVKPFHTLELSARIRAILNRYQRSLVKDCYQQRDLGVDFRSKKVSVRGEGIE